MSLLHRSRLEKSRGFRGLGRREKGRMDFQIGLCSVESEEGFSNQVRAAVISRDANSRSRASTTQRMRFLFSPIVQVRKLRLNSVKWRALGPSVLEPLVYLPLASGAQPGSSWPTSRLTGSWWFCTGSACSRIQISGLLITPWTLKIPKVKHQQAWGRWPAPADTAGLGDPRSPPVSPPVLHKEPSLLRCLLFSK